MSSNAITALTTVTAVASAAIGGVFYAFSTFVMRGLDRTGPVDAITAMRGINAEAQANVAFMALFAGSALLSVAVGVAAVLRLQQPGSWYLLAGAVLGVVGFVVTVAFNVPLNNRLDGLAPAAMSSTEAATEWRAYLTAWTAWNHVRTVSGIAAGALMVTGALRR
jgi:uncharacterized membrane protein